jgi:hypothetical protein
VRRVDTRTGIITTVAGSGEAGFSGDDGPASKARLNGPSDVVLDSDGNIYIAEYVNNRVRLVNAKNGFITTFAGNGLPQRMDILR